MTTHSTSAVEALQRIAAYMTTAEMDAAGVFIHDMEAHWNAIVSLARDAATATALERAPAGEDDTRPDLFDFITPEVIDAGAQRLVSFEDGSVWPDSWDAAQVVQARTLAERCIRSALGAIEHAMPAPAPCIPAPAVGPSREEIELRVGALEDATPILERVGLHLVANDCRYAAETLKCVIAFLPQAQAAPIPNPSADLGELVARIRRVTEDAEWGVMGAVWEGPRELLNEAGDALASLFSEDAR